jgi:hypothetical protein
MKLVQIRPTPTPISMNSIAAWPLLSIYQHKQTALQLVVVNRLQYTSLTGAGCHLSHDDGHYDTDLHYVPINTVLRWAHNISARRTQMSNVCCYTSSGSLYNEPTCWITPESTTLRSYTIVRGQYISPTIISPIHKALQPSPSKGICDAAAYEFWSW